MNPYDYPKIFTKIITSSSFIIAKLVTIPKPIKRRIDRSLYGQRTEYYTAIKNKLLILSKLCMTIINMLNGKSQPLISIYYMILIK